MADGRDQSAGFSYRTALPWTNLFRCFQVALDPRKLFIAAVGIFAMSFLWWVLSAAFYYKAPTKDDPAYSAAEVNKYFEDKENPATGKPYTSEELAPAVRDRSEKLFARDYAQWQELDKLAGPGGRLRTLPWYEYRGPNPFLFGTDVLGGSAADREKALGGFASGSVPVLIEPLVKLLLPVAKLVSPGISPQTRFYLFLILLSNVAVWAFCGGVITRLAAIQLANKGPVTFMQAVRFVAKRYLSYLGAPLVPLLIIGAVVAGLVVYGFVFTVIPLVGDLLLLGVGLPLVIVGGAIMTVFLVGLVGYPLMYTTLSAEGDQSDTFDALSRSVNYVYQAPWQYLWNWGVAVVYGAAVTLFVLFFVSLTVYVAKWAVGLPAGLIWQDRKPEYLFIYAPESFGWRELLTKDSPYAVQGDWVGVDRDGKPVPKDDATAIRQVYEYKQLDPKAYAANRADYWYRTWGAWIVCIWLTLAFLMMLGFSYSFFWSAATMIYLLMRKKVDEAELDEVYEDDEEPEAPLAPPKIAPPAATGGPTPLPVLAPPPAPPPVTPPAESATLPFKPAPVPVSPPPPVSPPAPAIDRSLTDPTKLDVPKVDVPKPTAEPESPKKPDEPPLR
jgi:hypothetical protein